MSSVSGDSSPRSDSRHAPVYGRRQKLFLLGAILLAVAATFAWRYRVTRPDYRLARGREAAESGQWERVEQIAADLDAAGRTDHALVLRADALLRRSQPESALALLNTVRDQGALRVDAVALSGRCLIDLGALREADRAFTFVIAEQPDHVEAHRGLAVIAYDLGQLDRALDHLEHVGRLDRKDGRPHRLMGLIYKDLAQLEAAETAYRESLRRSLAPSARQAVHRELGETLVLLTRFADALQALDEGAAAGVAKDDSWVAARAESLRGLNRQPEAVNEIDVGLQAYPKSAILWRIRGQLHLESKRSTEAAAALEQAVSLAPSDDQAHYLLGQAYTALGRTEDAAREFRRMEEIRGDLTRITDLTKDAMSRPWDAEVRLRLAEVSDRLGKPQLAAMWRSAAEACRSNPAIGPSR